MQLRLVEEASGTGDLVHDGRLLRRVPYRFSRYQGLAEGSGLPIPGRYKIEGRIELGFGTSAAAPAEWLGVALGLKLEDGRTLGITLADPDGRILSEGHGPMKCLCC